jgi:hypothetical protein
MLVAKAYPRRQLHVVVDNYATHKHQRVQAWLAKHPRVQLHFTPTYASWLNLVEVFFAITQARARRARGNWVGRLELHLACPPRLRSGSWRWSDLRLHPTSWSAPARCCRRLSGRLRTQHGPIPLKDGSSRGRVSLTCGWGFAGVGLGAPGPAAISMARPAPGANARR